MCSKPKIINWNTPTIFPVQLPLLCLRANFSCRLLYSHSDSLLYQVESHNLYYKLEKQTKDAVPVPTFQKKESDFSSYPDGHNDTNQCKVLKLKNEFIGDIISQFICLKPKMYSITSKGCYSYFFHG